jgi:type II secretory pathway component PulF
MYQYKAYTLDKQIVEGAIDAANESAAEERLSEAGYSHILTLKKTSPPLTLERLFPQLFSVQKADIVDFFGQLATLLEARVPFVQALWILSEQSKRAALKKIINQLGQQVSGGVPFSKVLAEYPRLVSSQYCQVIAVSEKSGDLPRGLKLVAGYMEKELSLASNVKRMLSYPAFLVVMSIFVILMVAMVAMPSLVKLFTALRVDLPLTTRIFIAVADIIITYKFHLILGIMSLVLGVVLLWRAPSFRRTLDRIELKTPVIGPVVIMRSLCRICRTASMLIEAGLTLPQSLNAVIGIIDNDVIKKILTEVRQDIIKGKGLSRQLGRYPVFPRMLVDVLAVGEKTGTLQASFTSLADHYEKKLDFRVKKLMSLIEPVSIMIVGLIISFIGISILQPLYSIYQNLGQG